MNKHVIHFSMPPFISSLHMQTDINFFLCLYICTHADIQPGRQNKYVCLYTIYNYTILHMHFKPSTCTTYMEHFYTFVHKKIYVVLHLNMSKCVTLKIFCLLSYCLL